ncbi:MAG: hypothetical protein IPN71_00560 [Fibrobacteres bacterium]|jgi:hypothetical protein|nr:hypothetical protein [Fibrobacterota bacterium]
MSLNLPAPLGGNPPRSSTLFVLVLVPLLRALGAGRELPSEIPPADSLERRHFAIRFVQDYLRQDLPSDSAAIDWVSRRPDVTESFKQAHAKLLREARKAQPDLGLEFDPILDAQDWPTGALDWKMDLPQGAMLLCVRDRPDITLSVRIVHRRHRLALDGIGVIRIADSLRAKR